MKTEGDYPVLRINLLFSTMTLSNIVRLNRDLSDSQAREISIKAYNVAKCHGEKQKIDP